LPKRDLISIECDFCGNHDTLDVRDSQDKVLSVIGKWRGVISGDTPPNQGADGHRWYDTLECLISGERDFEQKKKEEQDRANELNRITESMRKRGMMERAIEVAKA